MTEQRVTLRELDRADLLRLARDYVSRAHVGGGPWADLLSDAEVLDAARKVLLDVAELVVTKERRSLTRLVLMRAEDGSQRLMFEFADGTLFATPPA